MFPDLLSVTDMDKFGKPDSHLIWIEEKGGLPSQPRMIIRKIQEIVYR